MNKQLKNTSCFDRSKLQQKQNFDEQDITSGFIMNLIKLTQQNIRLGKQTINNERENNAHRQIHNSFYGLYLEEWKAK
jgi:hypothetical protein